MWEHWHSPRRKAWEQRLGKTEEKIIPMVVPDQDRSKKVRTKVCPWIQQLGSHQYQKVSAVWWSEVEESREDKEKGQ